ncbi:GW dipeptide domain-containing protein [Azoarcus sp. DN11]|uniref:GW dipeptide domain-containing protein n=1 Tax=Azoarcus sp. DN11 TaxID=356837 RepID=UPI00256FCF0B|nr:GW dipeptide domain-containing protein [Azoarcus sp. DN11]
MKAWLLVAVAASVGLAACSKKEEAAAPSPAPQAAAPAAPAGPAAVSAATPNTGKVVQLQQGGGYTYAEVETANGEKVWIAGGQIEVKAGDTVQWGDSAVMTNFASKSLNRTFDRILFVNAWGPAGSAPTGVAPHGTQPLAGPAMGQHPPMPGMQQPAAQAAAPAGSSGQVKSVVNGGGYTYLEVQQNGATVWVAAPVTEAKAGDTVSWGDGMVMTNFTSTSLNRKFDQIIFASAVRVGK